MGYVRTRTPLMAEINLLPDHWYHYSDGMFAARAMTNIDELNNAEDALLAR